MKSATEVERYLSALLREARRIADLLDDHYEKWGDDWECDEALEGFSEITEPTAQIENSIRCATDTAILMAAIDLESTINRFCFYNLGEPTADAIENLSLTAKLEVAHRAMGLQRFKGSKPYECVRDLVVWRNAFAHGKIPGMPVRSLRANHLVKPKEFCASVENEVKQMVKLVSGYILVDRYLSSIGQHPATSFHKLDLDDIEEWVERIETFRFVDGFIDSTTRRKRNPTLREPFYR